MTGPVWAVRLAWRLGVTRYSGWTDYIGGRWLQFPAGLAGPTWAVRLAKLSGVKP